MSFRQPIPVVFSKWIEQGVWKCPRASKPANWPEHLGYVSYGYNGNGLSARTDTNSLGLGGYNVWKGSELPAPPTSEPEVVRPSEMIAIGDGFYGGNGVVVDGSLMLWRSSGAEDRVGSTKRTYSRHQGKANVVFCDGHVESPTLGFLFTDTSDEALSRWNRDHLPHRERLAP